MAADNSTTNTDLVNSTSGEQESLREKLPTIQEDTIEWVVDGTEEEDQKVELALVARVLTNRSVNNTAFMNTITNVWMPVHGVEPSCIGKNLFYFQFFHWRDKQKVLEDQPWHFDRHALLIGEVNGEVKPSEIQLSTLPIWARVYDLPFKGRGNETNARMIGDKIGSYIGVDKSESLDKSLRIRVSIDVHKPLVQKIKIKTRGGGERRLCGELGHGEKECDAHRGDFSPKKNYGVWLRASPWRRVKVWQKEEGPPTCARRLFITKPEKGSNVVADKVSEVTQTLSNVNLQGSDDVTPNNPNEGPMTSALERVTGGTQANNKSKTWKRIARVPKGTIVEVLYGAGSKRNHEDPETYEGVKKMATSPEKEDVINFLTRDNEEVNHDKVAVLGESRHREEQ
ncbi:Sensitive to high expression protein 9-like protein mitochondrial [Bienertia sinuspersici]